MTLTEVDPMKDIFINLCQLSELLPVYLSIYL